MTSSAWHLPMLNGRCARCDQDVSEQSGGEQCPLGAPAALNAAPSHLEQAQQCLRELSLRAATLSTDQLIALTTAHATLALSEVPEGPAAEHVAGWLGSLDADELERAALEREDAYQGGTRAILAQLQDYLRAGLPDA